MADPVVFSYIFRFPDGSGKSFTLSLDSATLRLLGGPAAAPPPWAALQCNRCENCTLDPADHDFCPVALNLSDVAAGFRDHFAYEKVTVTVSAPERTYLKDTILQEGLGGLLGIVMVSSGCPVMEYLKPMVRFHLPFATLPEIVFRMVSTYLLSRYLRNREGKTADWEIEGIERIYEEVGTVNRCFMERIAGAAEKDANANALVNLDCFASMMPLVIEDTLAEFKPYFEAYLR